MSNRYVITGGAGFIGRHLCELLLDEGHEVRVIDALVAQVHGEVSSERGQPGLPPRVELIEGDLRDAALVRRALVGADGVFHLAAEVGVGQSMYEIARYVGGNDLGTAVLLEEIIRNPVRRLVVASSMSVYGEGLYEGPEGGRFDAVRRISREGSAATRAMGTANGNALQWAGTPASVSWDPVGEAGEKLRPIPTDESKPVDLASIYALTKYQQERSCLIIGEAYGIDTVALRLFNVFGPGQALSNPYTGVLANFGARLMNGQPPLIFEDGRQKRDFVHVRDVARAFHLAMTAKEAAGAVINIGSGEAYEIVQVARMLAEALGRPELEPTILGKARAGDIRHCFADISLARRVLGYEPLHQLPHSMQEMADWLGSASSIDRGEDARRQLEERGLVA